MGRPLNCPYARMGAATVTLATSDLPARQRLRRAALELLQVQRLVVDGPNAARVRELVKRLTAAKHKDVVDAIFESIQNMEDEEVALVVREFFLLEAALAVDRRRG